MSFEPICPLSGQPSEPFTLPGIHLPGKPRSFAKMARRPRDQTFRKTDLVRAIKAAKAAGVPNPRVEIDLRHGKISIFTGEQGAAPQESAADTPEEIIGRL
jgi:hypothetical protein